MSTFWGIIFAIFGAKNCTTAVIKNEKKPEGFFSFQHVIIF